MINLPKKQTVFFCRAHEAWTVAKYIGWCDVAQKRISDSQINLKFNWTTKLLQTAIGRYELVAETVKQRQQQQLRGSGATAVDEIGPGYLKTLDILGLS